MMIDDESLREHARHSLGPEPPIALDVREDAPVRRERVGAWVQAWVWVRYTDVDAPDVPGEVRWNR